ncbi:MAG: CRISPR-associated endonuclease Cas1, partial [Gemmataceae bacterium]
LNPLPLNDLGWTQTETKPPRWQYPLPGEETDATTQPEATLILGPERQSIRIEAGELHITYPIPPSPAAISLQSFQDVLFLGPIAGQNDISETLLRQGKTLWFANDSGYPYGVAHGTDQLPEEALVLLAQCRAAQDAARCLKLARPLIAAKLRNYATLAESFPRTDGRPDDIAPALRKLAEDSFSCKSLASLRGLEGAGAARWYTRLSYRLPYGFYFRKRVAPNATDPVNVLLNLAHTILHQHCILAARSAGLSPAVGFLHEARAGHAALASDLQEPFRHFMDRCVLEACRWLKTGDFAQGDPLESRHELVIRPSAARKFVTLIHWQLAQQYRRGSQTKSVRGWIMTSARNLRHVTLNSKQAVVPFEHLS